MPSTTLPLFPLSSVLVPGAPLPLHIFEPRYRELVADLLAMPEKERRFGVVAIKRGRETGNDGVSALYDVGCVALVTEAEELPDGRYELATVGVARFRLEDLVEGGTSYLQAQVEMLPELSGDAEELTTAVARGYLGYLQALADAGREVPVQPDLPADPLLLSYLVAATVVLDLADRQRLLAAPDAATRLAEERVLLARENALLRAVPSVPGTAIMQVPWSPN
jgi:Lon protease-like protein